MKTIQRHWQHQAHKTQDEDTKTQLKRWTTRTPYVTGFTEKYVYKADFDNKIIWASFTLKSLKFFLMLILYLSLNWDNCSNFISFGGKMWLYWFCRCVLPLRTIY
jgi:hypothetical protein